MEDIESKLKAALSQSGGRVIDDPFLTPAAVLILAYPKRGEPHVLFTRRTEEVEHHKGEVSFPGGAQDPEDSGLLETALREGQEEMGIAPEDVTILGKLDQTSTGTGFVVQAFVGTIPAGYAFQPNPVEIDEVIEVPLSALMASEHRRSETRLVGGRTIEACSFIHSGNLIWGATAGMLRQLIEMLETFGQEGIKA